MSFLSLNQQAREQRDQLRRDDKRRVARFLIEQYKEVADAREELETAMWNRDEATGAAQIAAAEHEVNTAQALADQAEEVLRIRERRARRLYPDDFQWLS